MNSLNNTNNLTLEFKTELAEPECQVLEVVVLSLFLMCEILLPIIAGCYFAYLEESEERES